MAAFFPTEPSINFEDSDSADSEGMDIDAGDDSEDGEEEADDYGDMAERDDDDFTKLLGQMRSRYEGSAAACLQ